MRWRSAVLPLLTVVLLCALGPSVASAQDGASPVGPTLTLDRSTIRPGERVVVTIEGFDGTAVTISVCGNQARRGSSDCNMTASEGLGLDADGTTITEFPVAAPAGTCPCVIRASTLTFDELAIAPIELVGHPVGPVVESEKLAPVEVSVTAERAPKGILARLRSALGGPTGYDVTVSVRNRSAERLEHVVLTGSASRGGDDVADITLPKAVALEAGQIWRSTVRSQVPAPTLGTFEFEVTASGAGPSVSAGTSSRSVPVGFLLLISVLIVDVAMIVQRRRARRRALTGGDDEHDPEDAFEGADLPATVVA